MLGPIGSEIMGIFRLLSPHEIDRYIVDAKDESVGATMKMAANGEPLQYNDEKPHLENSQQNKFPKDHSAEIIPLAKKHSSEENKPQENDSNNEIRNEHNFQNEQENEKSPITNENSALESVGILSANAIKNQERRRLKEENDKKDSTTVFLLKEREKSRQSKRRLTEMYALKSYQTAVNQEFNSDYDEDEEGNRVSDNLKGILLNKKQS